MIDRFPDFTKQVQLKGADPAPVPDAQALFPDIMSKVEVAESLMRSAKEDIDEMAECCFDLESCVIQADENALAERVATVSERARRTISEARDAITQLGKSEQGHAGTAHSRIRHGFGQLLARDLQHLVPRLQTEQARFEAMRKARTIEQLQVVCPDMTEDKIMEAVDRGADAATTVQERLNGVPLTVLNEYRSVEAKYQDVMRLQKSILEVKQLFHDMAGLVEQQGEMLDHIEINIQKTTDTTSKANDVLVDTRRHVRDLSKWRSICLCIMVGIIFYVIRSFILPDW
jgi:t-SNARE complex subunit (syntaxin)